jgi:hypothetical protein
MKKLITLLIFLMGASVSFAQFSSIASFNAAEDQITPDSIRAWGGDQGIRTIWSGADMDGDGLQEILATDYSNGGRVHVFEKNGDALELVFSTPVRSGQSSGSTPRWVRTGDLDGDGNMEFIFSVNTDGGDGEIQVWEFTGTDNDYGTTPAITLQADAFSAQGIGNFRTNRETGTVYDFDGDGKDELITANRDNGTYVLGVLGSFPGFASFQVEAGNPGTYQQIGKGSWWNSIPADITGDGNVEIVNHYWNFLGFWSAKATAANTYEYPDTTTGGTPPAYFEYLNDVGEDGVAYMGVHAADVDGDGKDEIFGVIYVGNGDRNYEPFIVDPTDAHDGIYGWDAAGFNNVADSLWKLAGKENGSHWGAAAFDFNENGRDELLLGGSADYNLISMEYSGTGDILDPASYDNSIVFEGAANVFHNVDIRIDSVGAVDTLFYEGPFVSKAYAGADVDGNGKKEVVLGYQSVADSITYRRLVWDFVDNSFTTDSTWKIFNPMAVNIRVLEYTGTTGFREIDLSLVTPEDYILEQNYPNPFNPTTTINFTLPLDKNISLVVYDVLGKEVKTLLNNEDLKKGSHQVAWDGTNNFNQQVASGNYIYTLKFGNFSKSAKMTLLK